MRWLTLIAVTSLAALGVENGPDPSVRERMRARILETLPARSPPASESRESEQDRVLVLEPMVVTESRISRALEKQLAREQELRKAESFGPSKGGTILRGERVELGGWWKPDSGWQFLRIKW